MATASHVTQPDLKGSVGGRSGKVGWTALTVQGFHIAWGVYHLAWYSTALWHQESHLHIGEVQEGRMMSNDRRKRLVFAWFCYIAQSAM